MNQTIQKLLQGKADNHMLPFFWQHGEDEATLREYMAAIDGANCHAVCVESRPHPDFCGPKWWADMDVILDEARKRDMKVWILDDSHFPTGFANGAMKNYPDRLCKQNVFMTSRVLEDGMTELNLREAGLLQMPKKELTGIAAYTANIPPARVYDDDSILSISARCGETVIDLTDAVEGDILHWQKPEGQWTLQVCMRSRNTGYHRDYINMTEEESCKVLLDAVYEPHWQHYAADFGKTIAGFFSDEPELGNGMMYGKENFLGTDQDLPWGEKLEALVAAKLGENWRTLIPLLWSEGVEAAKVRTVYMDCLTKRVREAFSNQVGTWCRDHGVQYIGHVIEDDGQHCRTGSSLGHYFRGLQGQDMAGIDDIGGQVLPQGEDEPKLNFMRQKRDGQFYHYGLAKLAQSAAAIEPLKKGNAMCEIFGNYGWEEGVRLEKYLADHFLVRGINYFVPHAFTAKAFPDPDCPPHFYAHGHNPQYRHFGEICAYMNRVATLTSSGKHVAPVAVLYHGESEWADSSAMPFEAPLRVLYDNQIDCHVLPADIFCEPEYYPVKLGDPLNVNGQEYQAFIVPEASVLSDAAADGLTKLMALGLPVYCVNRAPENLPNAKVVLLEELTAAVRGLGLNTPVVTPANDRIRILHIDGDTPVYFLVNEGTETWTGSLTLQSEGACYLYDPWFNTCHAADVGNLTIEPLKSIFLLFGDHGELTAPVVCAGEAVELTDWTRSICEGSQYPNFEDKKQVRLPDDLAGEKPEFSGFVRYETTITAESGCVLEITDAAEAVEVFLNGKSLGIQIAPPMRYELPAVPGENKLVIEVATTLERQCYPLLEGFRKMLAGVPSSPSGLNGKVYIYQTREI